MSKKKKIKINIDSEEVSEKSEPDAESGDNDLADDTVDDTVDDTGRKKSNDEPAKDPISELQAKLKFKEEEAKETYDRLLRNSAEFENYKKRSAREMDDFRKFANQSLLKEMLTVVDNLELALNSVNPDQADEYPLLEGLELTHKEILRVFQKFNVKPIEAMGELFDPTYHEAVMQEETDEYPENSIINVLQKGYLIHERLLRPAMVVVAKPKSKKAD
jgi:molecular chaperone GrpE